MARGMALARREDAGTNQVLRQARHYMRFLRYDQGEKQEEIAKSEGVTVKAIEKSIALVRLHRGLNTQQNLNTAVVGMLMGNLGKADRTLRRMFSAKNYIEHKLEDGTTKLMPIDDTKVQMQALEIYGKYMEVMQPRGGGVSLNVQQNNSNQVTTTNARSGGFEEVLHSIIGDVKAHNELPYQTADVIEGEESDENEDDEDEDDE